MYPVKMTLLLPVPFSKSCSSVPVKDPGNCFLMTLSPSWGLSSPNSSASSVPGVNTGAPSGVAWTTWMMGALEPRYLLRSEAITLRDLSTFLTVNLPLAYSFCASMMTRVLSLVEAVEGCTPIIDRKLAADAILAATVSSEVDCSGEIYLVHSLVCIVVIWRTVETLYKHDIMASSRSLGKRQSSQTRGLRNLGPDPIKNHIR